MSRNCRREIREGALGERLGKGHFGELRAKGGWMTVAGKGWARQHFAFQRHYESLLPACGGGGGGERVGQLEGSVLIS